MKVKITNNCLNAHDCKVFIDGHDVTRNLTEIDVKIKADEIPTLKLAFYPDDIEIEGDFEVLKKIPQEESKDINDHDIKEMNKIYNMITEILYSELEDINEEIRGKIIKGYHDSENIKFIGSTLENTISMWKYARSTKDIYDKAYVMKSVLDNVLETYFNALKEIELNK